MSQILLSFFVAILALCNLVCAADLPTPPTDQPAATQSAPPVAVPKETDKRLPPGRPGGWGFKPASNPDGSLPHVLLIGDSVCNGYRDGVAASLKGQANIDAWITPYHQASPALLPDTLAILKQGGPYAVIHFNMGLHGWVKGRIPDGQYTPLMTAWVKTLEENAHGATLIWASITPVTTKAEKGRSLGLDDQINPTIVEQNALAAKIMATEHIPIDDLYGLMTDKLNLAGGDQFHWTKAGSELLAKTVAAMILKNLAAPTAAASTPPSSSTPSR